MIIIVVYILCVIGTYQVVPLSIHYRFIVPFINIDLILFIIKFMLLQIFSFGQSSYMLFFIQIIHHISFDEGFFTLCSYIRSWGCL